MKERKELEGVVSCWNEIYPNRKNQPTLLFVTDTILQSISKDLGFVICEENDKTLTFKCLNFPLIGELDLNKKAENLSLFFDLNPYSLVINGEERSREYTITAFKCDLKHRVAEFVFLHYVDLQKQLISLQKAYLGFSIQSMYMNHVDTKFVLDFNGMFNKAELLLNNIHIQLSNLIGTSYFSNSVYSLTSNCRCVPKALYKYGSVSETSDGSSHSNITLRVEVVPVVGKLENRKCFDAVYSFVKEKLKEQYREYSLKDLENRKANIFGNDIQCVSFPDTLILNETTFKNIFPDRFLPEWSLMWSVCSIYITEDISDGHILFIISSNDMRNPICIDKENNRYYVNETSKDILAFNVSTKSKDELVTITD